MLTHTRNFTSPLNVIREFDRAFQHATGQAALAADAPTPAVPVDAWEEDGRLTIQADLPGYAKHEVHVDVEDGVLTLRAEHAKPVEEVREDDAEAGEQAGEQEPTRVHFLRERRRGVTRRFRLPKAYDTHALEASLADGVLTLTVPQREEVKPRQIEVK